MTVAPAGTISASNAAPLRYIGFAVSVVSTPAREVCVIARVELATEIPLVNLISIVALFSNLNVAPKVTVLAAVLAAVEQTPSFVIP